MQLHLLNRKLCVLGGLWFSQLLLHFRKRCLEGRAWKGAGKYAIILLEANCLTHGSGIIYKKGLERLRVEFEKRGLKYHNLKLKANVEN